MRLLTPGSRLRQLAPTRGVNGVGAGGGATWTPARLSLAFTLLPALSRSLGLLWQDSGKTILATAAADPVRVAKCPFTGIELTAPSDAARPLLRDEGGGKWSLDADGTDDELLYPSGLAIGYGGVVHLWEGGGTTFSDFKAIWSGSSAVYRGNSGTALWRSPGVAPDGPFGASVRVDAVTTLTINPFGTWHVTDGYTASPPATTSTAIFSDASAAGRWWNGRCAGILAATADPGAAHREAAYEYMLALKP